MIIIKNNNNKLHISKNKNNNNLHSTKNVYIYK